MPQVGDINMKKQPELTAQTRQNLINAFWSLYCEKKIECITVKEITEKAEYHRSTFYEYFVDIYDVLNQLEESLLEYIKEKVLKNLDIGQQSDLTQPLADLFESKGKYLSILLGETGDPYFANKMKALLRPALMDSFGLSENEVHTAYIFDFAFAAIFAALTHWYQSGKNIASIELTSMIRSMLFNGVFQVVQKYSTVSSKM